MPSTLVIVSCGASKIWDKNPLAGPTPAKDAYIGPLFKLNREYAERFSDRWMILSAKYGFIDPDFIIPENYNVTFKDPKTNPVSLNILREQVHEMGLDKFDKIIVLGGKDYVDVILKAFQGLNVKIIAPLKGLSIGLAMKKVKDALRSGKPFEAA